MDMFLQIDISLLWILVLARLWFNAGKNKPYRKKKNLLEFSFLPRNAINYDNAINDNNFPTFKIITYIEYEESNGQNFPTVKYRKFLAKHQNPYNLITYFMFE